MLVHGSRLAPVRTILALALAVAAPAAHASTPRLLVAPKDRWVVAYAYANSATFRETVDRLRRRSGVVVRLESVPQREIAPSSALGITRWAELPRATRLGSRAVFSGVVVCRARLAGVRELAARFAHELAHAEELARYGSIDRAPGVRASHDDRGAAETENAISVGQRVLQELARVPAVADAAFARQLLGPEEWFDGWSMRALLAQAALQVAPDEGGLPSVASRLSPDRAGGPLSVAPGKSD